MSFLGDVLDFEKSALKDHVGKLKENPERILIGAGDPISSKAWGAVLKKDYEPLVDQWGGAPKDAYANAEARGIDTTAGAGMHQVARTIAASYAGGYAADKLGVPSEALSMPEGQQQQDPPSQQKQALMERAAQLRARIEQLKLEKNKAADPVKMADGGQITRTDMVVQNLKSYGVL